MLSIGWVIFWKSLVASGLAGLGGWWSAFRQRRREQGITLRQDRKTGVYVVSDWAERLERFGRRAWNALFVLILLWWVVLFYLLIQ